MAPVSSGVQRPGAMRPSVGFGFAPDGSRMCIAIGDEVSHLMIARGVDVE